VILFTSLHCIVATRLSGGCGSTLGRFKVDRKLQPLPLISLTALGVWIAMLLPCPGIAAEGQSPASEQTLSIELAEGWQLIRSRNPEGGNDAVSIVRAADTSRSDLELVGLMVRCGEKEAQVLVAVLSALPASSRPLVRFGIPADQADFQATIAAPGTLVLLPDDATKMLSERWQSKDLLVRIDNSGSVISGLIKLAGFSAAFDKLKSACRGH
jgi:hypothetical protein